MAPSEDVVLRVENLVKHFPVTRGIIFQKQIGAVRAVDGVSFDLHRGETLGVVGESGCGKSTLARLLMRLETPTSGQVTMNGRDVFALSGSDLRALRRDIQMVMQDPYTSLNPRMTVGDIIGEPFEIHTEVAPKGSREGRVRELLEFVGLNPEHINRYPHQFSGGQRQRIGIARALALKPSVIVCDEPVSALDVSIQAQVINLLERLQSELDLSYVFIAHDLGVVRHVSDRIAVMYLGRIVEQGDARDVIERPGHPYTKALVEAVPPRKQRTPLGGELPDAANLPTGCRFHPRCPRRFEPCDQEDPPLFGAGEPGHEAACLLLKP